MASLQLTPDDCADLKRRGIPQAEVERQLALFRQSLPPVRLLRPCTVGDGIVGIVEPELGELRALHDEAQAAGRITKFVPASGAATRMFRDLVYFLDGPGAGASWSAIRHDADRGDSAAATLVQFLAQVERFAFHGCLERRLEQRGSELSRLARSGDYAPVLAALLRPAGMDYERLPKGLLEFHAYPDDTRTPFEEHLVEAAHYARDAAGRCRLHFTVSPEHRERFEALAATEVPFYANKFGATFEIDWSAQKPSTDTIAVSPDDVPLRDDAGRLVFRPGGHGALIENLADLDADLVLIKNIDNVQPDHLKGATLTWKRTLVGFALRLERRAHELLRRLRAEALDLALLDSAAEFAGSRLAAALNGRLDTRTPEARRAWLIDRLSRPLRVCGVVRNTGEPGGGPFWVRGRDGSVSLQIVEGAQIDLKAADQRAIFEASTHFNPVDLVCALRAGDGRPYDLHAFIDPSVAIVTTKSSAGRTVKALERPGLWNGAMAGWNTVFVEVPLETFTPVKTVLDLLRPEHQPAP